MTRRIVKYNPAFLSDDELISAFVARQAEFELILQTIRENTGQANQHILLVGPRGIGKTTLALRVKAELLRNPEFSDKWFPIVFGEEGYEISTPGEFWLETLFHLAEQTQDEELRRSYEALKEQKDEEILRLSTLAQLMDVADSKGKRLMVVVENFNLILTDQLLEKEDDWVIRHTLLNEPRVMLLATATSWGKEVANAGKAMFELFNKIELFRLNQEDCQSLWESITGKKPDKNRIRPIQILTGGNPRLVTIIAVFAAEMSFKRLMDQIMQLVDEHTEYFKSRLDGLPPVERKAYLALAEIWDPASTAEAAAEARLAVSKTSALLKRLVDRGLVMEVEQKGRKKFYQVAERMYNIYYLMRRRGGASGRVKAFVNFLIGFYAPEELLEVTHLIAKEACGLKKSDQEIHFQTLKGIIEKAPDDEWLKSAVNRMPKEALTIFQSYVPLVDQLKHDHRENQSILAPTTAPPVTAQDWVNNGKYLEQELEQYDEAEGAYRKAIDIDPQFASAWRLLGKLLHEKMERFNEAEIAYRKVVEIDPLDAWSWVEMGYILHARMNRVDDAESAFEKAVKIDPEIALAWGQLGLILERKKRFDEAEVAYRKIVELKPNVALGWELLGELLHEKLNRFSEAEEAYRRAIAIKPTASAWGKLGKLLHESLEHYKDAEEAYRKAIAYDPNAAWIWVQLGQLLHVPLNKFRESEMAYLKAIEIDDETPGIAYGMLTVLKFDNPDVSAKQAFEFALNIIKKNQDNPNIIASVLVALCAFSAYADVAQLEFWARRAIELSRGNTTFPLLLLPIFVITRKPDEAMQKAEKVLEDTECVESYPEAVTNLFIDLAAAGKAKESLDVLGQSPSKDLLEPLIIGINLFLGKRKRKAVEIMEVAQDVKDRIEKRKIEIEKVWAEIEQANQ